MHTDLGEQYLTREQVCAKLGFKSLSSLYRLIEHRSDFPKPRKIGTSRQSAVRYVLSEVDSWMLANFSD